MSETGLLVTTTTRLDVSLDIPAGPHLLRPLHPSDSKKITEIVRRLALVLGKRVLQQ